MKRFAFLLGIFLLGATANAQNASEDYNTIFGKGGETRIGWYIGIESGYTKYDKRDVWLGGLTGAMVINHNFTLGLTGRGWTNRESLYFPDIADTTGAYLEGGYGGLLLEYVLFPKSPVHLTFPILIGGGAATYVSTEESLEWDDDGWDTEHEVLDYDAFFVLEPGVRVELNLLKFMRLNAGVSYHYTNGQNLVNTPDDFMDNFTASVGLKFGKF